MAQRYGRRRKRAHLARIASLEIAHQSEKKLALRLATEAVDLRHEIEKWDDEITRLLGEYSAFLSKTPVVQTRHPIRKLPIRTRLPDDYRASAEIRPDMIDMARQRMRRFITLCEREDHRLRLLVRLIEDSDRTNQAAYLISEELMNCKFGNREIEHFAHQIANDIAQHMQPRRG